MANSGPASGVEDGLARPRSDRSQPCTIPPHRPAPDKERIRGKAGGSPSGRRGQCRECARHVAWPLKDGEPTKDWWPGTQTIQEIRPGSAVSRIYEGRQRKPDDLEAGSQRAIAVHARENPATSDTTSDTGIAHCIARADQAGKRRSRSDECDMG
jgi:hypothetical protein